ncbi:protein OSB2, chloroplastic-like [Iris pallida]|uniref:Protein OSB2, chloroplastic-like n=1 Tax=Iris pallida TaxID=29817 RepID=A0AAX6E1T3_IRIPA|nr:protein OSB2, chloroplastic-like [Iris pallida]KAJ6832946.1 protein OSB2, chloroplastic-like [Iris pallida]
MALPSLFHLNTTIIPKSHFPPLITTTNKPLNPNPNPNLFPLSLRPIPKPPARLRSIRSSSSGHGGGDYLQPRPQEIPWSKDLANSVHLIGTVGAPVQTKHLSSGKLLAWSRLAVKKSPTETSWINLTFWDELAHTAAQHLEKGQQVYVSGRLVSDTVEGEDEKKQVYYKVVVQKFNFIERSFPALPLYDSESNSMNAGGKFGNYSGNSSGSTEELWQAFFANPMEWWDNRRNKRNPKYPDFKHKDTGEALWIEGKFNPSWVKSQLAVLDSRMGSQQANETNHAVSFMHNDDFTNF